MKVFRQERVQELEAGLEDAQSELRQARSALEASTSEHQDAAGLKAEVVSAETRVHELGQQLQLGQQHCQELEGINM